MIRFGVYNRGWLYYYTLAIQPRVNLRTDDAFGNDHANIYPHTRLHTELYYLKSRIIPNFIKKGMNNYVARSFSICLLDYLWDKKCTPPPSSDILRVCNVSPSAVDDLGTFKMPHSYYDVSDTNVDSYNTVLPCSKDGPHSMLFSDNIPAISFSNLNANAEEYIPTGTSNHNAYIPTGTSNHNAYIPTGTSNHNAYFNDDINPRVGAIVAVSYIGDFNCEMSDEVMGNFCNTYNLRCLIKEATCFKNVHNPSCIYLILTNRPLSFQNTNVIETGLSDFHKLTLTVVKSTFQKQVSKIFHYRNYKRFDNTLFQYDLMYEISNVGLNDISCEQFENIFMLILNRHAPSKTRYVRANHAPFMNTDIYKAIMVRSRLRNKYLKLKTEEANSAYKKQRNHCVSLIRKAKCDFYEHLNPKLICDNRKFWRQVKPFFSDKTPYNCNITLKEKNEIVTDPSKCSEIFNNFFIDTVKCL